MPRPTLLIGVGSYGLDALQRLLHQCALRGVLRWQETQKGGVAGARRHLQDLALLALPDPFEQVSVDPRVTAGAPQFLTDLYRQIQGPPPAARTDPAAVAQYVRGLADGLVSQTAFDRRDPLGLDLICLARPGTPDAIPHLDILLQHALEALADSSFFKVAVQGAGNLNAILILDFDDYWCGTGRAADVATARALRAALRNSMQSWERRRAAHRVGLDRCYLVDGRTAVGYRPPHVRSDEAVLFLELLLFEGLRTNRQALYQQQSLTQPVTTTFGIRLLEEGTLLRSREAAATFGRRWLDALLGDAIQCPDRAPRRVLDTLEPVRPQAMALHLQGRPLEHLFESRADQLVGVLMAVPEQQAADWLDRVQAVFERERLALEQALERAAWGLISVFKETHTKDLERRLGAAVDGDLHDERAPASVTLVRAALGEVRQGLVPGPDQGPLPAAEVVTELRVPLRRLGQMHQAYRAQCDEWLARQGRALQWFWPLFALLLAVGLAGLTVRVTAQINLSGLAWLDASLQVLRAANHPLTWTLLWFVVLWIILARRVQPLITGRIARAQRFFASTERGRFHDHCRALVDALRTPLLARVRRNLNAGLTNDVHKALSRIDDRLAERAREMDWLRRQLTEFLRLSNQPTMAVRQWLRGDAELETILAPRPVARVCDPQEDVPRPFAGWREHYCDAFLDPLRFIDGLSKRYAQAAVQAQARRADADWPERRRDLIDFIDHAKLAPACRFLQDTGVTEERRWCITAGRWRSIPGVVEELNNRLGIIDEDIVPAVDDSRFYLLVLQAGIAADNLERRGAAPEPDP